MAATAATFVGKYTLTSCNGETSPEPITLELSAVEGKSDALQVMAAVANRMRGQATISDGKEDGSAAIKGMLMSTRMMGPPFMMTVERVLSQALMENGRIQVQDTTLTITHGDDKAVFKRD